MSESVKTTLLAAFRRLMIPLVRILLRHGVSFKEFAEAVKTVYVEVGSADFKLEGKRQSISRIAIITGLTRKEVGRIVDLLNRGDAISVSHVDRVSNVLRGWHQDPDYTGPYGVPRELHFDSSGGVSFTRLVRRYSGDMPARAMLEELLRVNAVDELSGGSLRVLSRSYIPNKVDPSKMEFMGLALRDLAETLDQNLDPKQERALFERRVWTPTGVRTELIPEFDGLVREYGQAYLERLDNWLSQNQERESPDEQASTNITKVGLGIYMFMDRDQDELKGGGKEK